MRRVVTAAAILLLTVGLSTSFALPAYAHNGGPGPNVGCVQGSSCQVELSDLIGSGGDFSPGSNGSINYPPPPCLWISEGGAIAGSNYIIGLYGNDPSKAPTGFQINQAVAKADQLLKNPAPGTWFWLPINPANPAGEAECLKLPAYYWAPPQHYPPINIPVSTIREYAFNGLKTATVNSLTVNPSKVSDVNLPTYVTAHLTTPTAGAWVINGKQLYIAATAYLKSNPAESVTVWAVSSALNIDAGGPAHTYDNCPARQLGRNFVMGTMASASQEGQAGPGQAIDCGVTYLSPSSPTYKLSASVTWKAYWAMTPNATAPPSTPPASGTLINANLSESIFSQAIPVQEVQSSNGG